MPFRLWLQEMWYMHQLEIEEWTGKAPGYSAQDYFGRNRWFLRRMYRLWQKRHELA